MVNLCVSHDDAMVAALGANGWITVWDISTQSIVLHSKAHTLPGELGVEHMTIAFSPDSRQLLTAGADKFVRIWDVTRDVPVKVLQCGSARVVHAGWTNDGRFIVTAGGEGVRFWDTASWACVPHTGKDVFAPLSFVLMAHDTRLITIHRPRQLLTAWAFRVNDETKEAGLHVELELSNAAWHADSHPPLLTGDFEGATVDPLFEIRVDNIALTMDKLGSDEDDDYFDDEDDFEDDEYDLLAEEDDLDDYDDDDYFDDNLPNFRDYLIQHSDED